MSVDGNVSVCNAVHAMKHCLGIVVSRVLLSLTAVNAEQFWKQYSPSEVTLLGKFTLVSDVQL